MKKFLKSYCVGFIISVLLCGSVYAATYFASSDVTYDNGVSGLKSENVQDAIDELYTECTKEPTAGETIIENAGLEKDPYECRYFFTGATPNNYIKFNNELWRIISVECDETIKIMSNINAGSQVWDTGGSSNWARPTTLNTYLNGTYYNGLNNIAQNQIATKNWNIGAIAYNDNNLANTINNENTNKWTGKVALVTVSEYIRSNSNKSNCGTVQQLWNTINSCKETTWMYYPGNSWWTLSPTSNDSSGVFYVNYIGGDFSYNAVNYAAHVIRPALYLSSDIQIKGGTGTETDPYTIE